MASQNQRSSGYRSRHGGADTGWRQVGLHHSTSSLGNTVLAEGASRPPPLTRYLHCYHTLESRVGGLLGLALHLAPLGSSFVTLHVKNSDGFNVTVNNCRSREQMNDCSRTPASLVFGFWIVYRCCFLDFCNNPTNRKTTTR
ncbi:lymphocyte antigen 6 complex locus protein G5c [Peromyscus maniculatus bairdii]|uniref:lymphocyte antigen 6 complex locus protein G5c n=1 Tax=Peromyscus maniculatus bairdii TaxID=230844 RepID=UPI003FD4234D